MNVGYTPHPENTAQNRPPQPGNLPQSSPPNGGPVCHQRPPFPGKYLCILRTALDTANFI